jgi:colicin import membrane protein
LNSATSHYLIPAEPGRGRALALASLVHFLLLVFLWFGVSWQSDTPTEVEAEIWSPVLREAAPPPPPPIAKPIQEPPKPVAAITPPTPPAPVVQPEPAQQKLAEPDIALEKEKKRKQEKEDAERLKKEKLAEKKALEEEQKRKKIADAEAKEKKRKQENEDAELLKKEKLAERKAFDEEQKRAAVDKAADDKIKQRMRDDLTRQTKDDGAGDAEKSQGLRGDNSYALTLRTLIHKNTTKIANAADIVGNPAVEFRIRLLPDGNLRSAPELIKSSGIEAFDQAVKRAIEKSTPFPPDPSTGKVLPYFDIQHRPKDSATR